MNSRRVAFPELWQRRFYSSTRERDVTVGMVETFLPFMDRMVVER